MIVERADREFLAAMESAMQVAPQPARVAQTLALQGEVARVKKERPVQSQCTSADRRLSAARLGSQHCALVTPALLRVKGFFGK